VNIKQGKRDVRKELSKVEEELQNNITKESEVDKEVKKLYRKLKPVDESVTDINGMKVDKEKLTRVVLKYDRESAEIKSRHEKVSFKLNETKSKIESYKEQGIETQYAELEQLENNRQDTRIEIDKLQISVRSKLDKLEKLQDLEYDPDCNYCMNNIFVKDAIKTKNDLETDKVLADKYVNSIDGLDNKIKRLFHVKNHKEDFDNLIKELKEINISYNNNQSNMIIVDEKKKNVMSQIKHLQERISKYYEQEQDVIYNNEINKHIDDLVIEQTTFRNKIKKLNNEVKDFYASLQVLENKRRTIVRNIKKIEDLENENAAYQYYLDAIKRDGVPYELITKALPTIEGEVNNILSQLVEFQIIFEMDGKNINNYIVYDDDNVWPLEMSSGMERFISSLALRVGLMNVSNLPASNFLAIDEGWGTMDSENINSVYQLFQYLKTQFQFTLIVSHIDSMRDAVDTLLEIKKDKNFSSIAFA
jgi:DNA repair exonuclease SbcCD ATPase subunit